MTAVPLFRVLVGERSVGTSFSDTSVGSDVCKENFAIDYPRLRQRWVYCRRFPWKIGDLESLDLYENLR